MTEVLQAPKRRRLRFQNHEEALAEARSLAAQPTRQLGNWSLPAICAHLAAAMNLCIDGGTGFTVPLRTRILARLARGRVLRIGLPKGIQLPEQAAKVLYPEPASAEAAIAEMERAIARLKSTTARVPHPVLGKMNVAQWDLFHLRHAELHLSHIVPQ